MIKLQTDSDLRDVSIALHDDNNDDQPIAVVATFPSTATNPLQSSTPLQDLITSIHLAGVATYPYIRVDIVSFLCLLIWCAFVASDKYYIAYAHIWDLTNDIHLSGLST